MTMMDIGQFPKIDSEPPNFKLKWYGTKLIYPFKYSEGIHYFIQKDQEWVIDAIASWVKENHFKEDFPSVIDWKLKLTYQSFGDRIPWENPSHSVTLTCENRQNAKFKFSFMTVFSNTDIELYYDGDRIDKVSFCLLTNPDPSGMMMLMLEEEWVYLLGIASRLFT
jgi:hypothetical protein